MSDIRIGRTLGPYDIHEVLGGGGMATVYRGVHRALGVQRAIKVMSSSLATNDGFVELFYREARLAAGLRHPNIVQIFDIAQCEGLHYLVMELLEGRSLYDIISTDAPLPLRRVVHLVGQLAEALDHAHGRGIAHRDVKPANVFVGPSDELTLVDFGIARAADATHLTVTHGIGTPEYMAPEVFDEQLAAPGADEHAIGLGTDLYSLGVVAYVLVSGKLPFFGRTPNAVAYAQVNREPPPLRSLLPDLPAAIEAVILRQLSKKPDQRYGSARAFAAALGDAVRQANPVDAAPTIYGFATPLPSGTESDCPVCEHGRGPAISGTVAGHSGSRISERGAGRRRWLAPLLGLSLLAAGMIGIARIGEVPLLSPFAELSGPAEPRRVSNTLAAGVPTAAPTTAPTSPPLPTATSVPPTTVPTAIPTPETAQVAPTPDPRPNLELQADETIAQVIALIENQTDANADLAVEQLDRLHRELTPESDKRPVVEEVMIRVLLEDSQRRVRAAFTLKNANEGRESQRILSDARQRFDRAAQIRPNDATLQERVNQGREQLDLTGLWVDFDAAYYAKQNDAQIEALTKIVAKRPDFRTAEGPAREKLYAAWIAKAEEAWAARQAELARIALDEAMKLDPDHPRARLLRQSWFSPPRPAPVRAAAPARGGGRSGTAQGGPAEAPAPAPEAQPGPPVQQPQRLVPQNTFVNNEISSPNVGNQSHNSN